MLLDYFESQSFPNPADQSVAYENVNVALRIGFALTTTCTDLLGCQSVDSGWHFHTKYTLCVVVNLHATMQGLCCLVILVRRIMIT